MGGKSRKSGTVSKRLIARIKQNIVKQGKKEGNSNEKKNPIKTRGLFE